MDFTPPILNKDAPAFKKLDSILSEGPAFSILAAVNWGAIIVKAVFLESPSNKKTYSETFSQKELVQIHPEVHTLLLLATNNHIFPLQDTWECWNKNKAELKQLATNHKYLEGAIVSIADVSPPDKAGGAALIVSSEIYEINKIDFQESMVLTALKTTHANMITRSQCNKRYPGLLAQATAGFALGLHSDDILHSWKTSFYGGDSSLSSDLPIGDLFSRSI